ncbi:hypothetical protein PR202_ga19187 [Eleusine coracana subsp. coracana]|uniref:F-box protein n=1 Tax=Eleusine coracana subsp. coracana TaxID=191504 RepID=A0AAV5CVR9_ELECO|nr:hypothetical protein PR202_ga19187 [Eleusine coracana subsp. coracana]
MEKAAGEDEVVEERETAASSAGAPPGKKRKRVEASGAGICDDILSNILARLPTRSAVASMALSKHHHALNCSPEFRSLHCRLGAPLPRPHIAYVAAAAIRRMPEHDPVSGYYSFHVAGGGVKTNDDDPIRVLSGGRYLETSCANTCDGIVVLSCKEFSSSCRCTLWNPAVADDAVEVIISTFPGLSPESECIVLGLGRGRRSETYKMLVSRKDNTRYIGGGKLSGCREKWRSDYALLLISAPGDAHRQQDARLLTVLPTPPSSKEEINLKSLKSLYIDGTIYLLHVHEPTNILAVDIDDETVDTHRLARPAHRRCILAREAPAF